MIVKLKKLWLFQIGKAAKGDSNRPASLADFDAILQIIRGIIRQTGAFAAF